MQSKELLIRVLQNDPQTNTASDRQVMPHQHDDSNILGSLCWNDGRNAIRDGRLTAFKGASNPEGWIARMQE